MRTATVRVHELERLHAVLELLLALPLSWRGRDGGPRFDKPLRHSARNRLPDLLADETGNARTRMRKAHEQTRRGGRFLLV